VHHGLRCPSRDGGLLSLGWPYLMAWVALGWLRGAFGSVFRFMAHRPWQAAVIVLCALSLWLNHGKQAALDDRDALATRLVEQKAEYVAAQDAAKAKAEAARIATENRYAEIARRKRDDETAARDAIARYVAANRLQNACRPTSGTGKAGESDPAKRRDEPGGETEFLAVSRNDFDILVENTHRLERVHQWGNDLITEKLAVPEVEFGR
jgi:hypothetical protein